MPDEVRGRALSEDSATEFYESLFQRDVAPNGQGMGDEEVGGCFVNHAHRETERESKAEDGVSFDWFTIV